MTGEAPRIDRVTITTGSEERVLRVHPGDEHPDSVTVTFTDGKTVTVNTDGSTITEAPDGRTVSVDASGGVRVTAHRRPRPATRPDTVVISNSRGVQYGDGGIQTNVF